MTGALIDTSVLLDYLAGDRRAKAAMSVYSHRAISVVTWLEIMEKCPPEVLESTRSFLRTFERLSINEAIADDAFRIMKNNTGLEITRALTWATATINKLTWLCTEPPLNSQNDKTVVVPYRNKRRRRE